MYEFFDAKDANETIRIFCRTKHFAIIQETIDEISKFEGQKSCVLYANVNDEFYLSNLNLPSKNLLSEHPKIAHASSSVAIRLFIIEYSRYFIFSFASN